MTATSGWLLLFLVLVKPFFHSIRAEPIQLHQQSYYNNSSLSKTNQLQSGILQQPTTSKPPNYLETSRQITNILDKFMSLGYDKRVRPNYGGPPVEVNVTMRILSISSVSEVMMDFTADFYFRQTWHDPRLAFKRLENIKTLYVGAEVSKKIWLPDTFFGNEKLAYFHEATTPNVFLRIDHSGEVYRSIRLTVTSSCPMNLQYFPMDRQRCTIEAESYGYNVKDIIYRWARKDTAVERDKEISLPQFDIVKTVQKYRLEELSSGTYSRLIAEIHFARRMGYYLIQIYIPSSLIVVISWVSFWLHRNASPARVQLGVTTVLTMTTLMSSTNAALPKISYVKSIDIFLGTCFVMVFAALLEYATVGYLGKRIAMRKAQLQHAQSQAQARLFALAQAQGAQGDLVNPIGIPSGMGAGSSGTPNLFDISGPTMAATAATVGQQQFGLVPAPPPISVAELLPAPPGTSCAHFQEHAHLCAHEACLPVPPPRANNRQDSEEPDNGHNKCTCIHSSCPIRQTKGSQTLPRHITFNQDHDIVTTGCNHQSTHQWHIDQSHHHRRNHCGNDCNLNSKVNFKHDCNAHQQQECISQTNAICNNFPCQSGCFSCNRHGHHHQHQHQPQHHHHHHRHENNPHQHDHHDHHHHQQYQSGKTSNHSPQSPDKGEHKGAQAAATAAAATFVNMHRRNKGLPPSTNPNFAHYMSTWSGSYNRALETIFGIRPSDIDKYSRVVFPVCFICFQLMYWIVYLHISAFIETGEQPIDQLQQQPIPTTATTVLEQQAQQQPPQPFTIQPTQVPQQQQQHFQLINNNPFHQYQLAQSPS